MNEFLEDGLDGLDSYGFRKSVKTLVFADAELEAIARMCGVEIEDKRCMIPAEKLMQLGQHLMEMMPRKCRKRIWPEYQTGAGNLCVCPDLL